MKNNENNRIQLSQLGFTFKDHCIAFGIETGYFPTCGFVSLDFKDKEEIEKFIESLKYLIEKSEEE